jgi:hypothetical protein
MIAEASCMATDAAQGSIGAGTFVEPAKIGFDIIKRWRQRAPISVLITGKNEAARIPKQQELLEKAFGLHLTPRATDRFVMLTDSLQRLTQPLI